MTRVCLVSTGQPSTDPRLVKEADALTQHGYDVHVVGAHWAEWADRADAELCKGRAWSSRIIDWRRESAPGLFWKSRVRHRAARSLFHMPIVGRAFTVEAASRLTPELLAAASAWPADLYIAHNLGALPAAAEAARRHGARLGFDAEDYHRGQLAVDDKAAAAVVARIEEHYLPKCDYVSAASPGISEAYAGLCRRAPVVVLNVFPLADRPARHEPRRRGPFRLHWFSQTIGRDRGLEQVVAAMGLLKDLAVELHVRGVWQSGFAETLAAASATAGVAPGRIVRLDPAAPGEMVRLAAGYDTGLAFEQGHTTNSDIALSNKIFTYLLAGVPVLASGTRAQTALARELGAAATVVPIGDVTAVAGVLRRWIENPESLDSARRAAWHIGGSRFNWEAEQGRFLDVIRDVMGDRGHTRTTLRGLAS